MAAAEQFGPNSLLRTLVQVAGRTHVEGLGQVAAHTTLEAAAAVGRTVAGHIEAQVAVDSQVADRSHQSLLAAATEVVEGAVGLGTFVLI